MVLHGLAVDEPAHDERVAVRDELEQSQHESVHSGLHCQLMLQLSTKQTDIYKNSNSYTQDT